MNQKYIILSLLVTTLLSAFVLSSNIVSADNNSFVDNVNINVPVSCSMSATGMNSHTASINIGTYQPNIGTTTATIMCNDHEGFAIYAAGYTGNEVSDTNSNKLVGTSLSSNAVIESGIATSAGNPDVSNWAMKLAITQDSGDTTSPNNFTIDSAPNVYYPSQEDPTTTSYPFSNYHVVPNEYVKVAHKNSSTDMTPTTGGVKLTTTYAAYISNTQPADTYTGQVIYTLVHPSNGAKPIIPAPVECEPGKICYNANANGVVGSMGKQDLTKDKDWSQCLFTNYIDMCGGPTDYIDVNTLPELNQYKNSLYASNFSREGYGFAGWNDKYDMTGNNYGPIQTIVLPLEDVPNGLSLYAHWVESSGDLQNWTGCSSLSVNQVIGLTDTRDGNVYAVAKLADSNCWMIENLRLDNFAAPLNNSNTNNPASGFTSLAASNSNWCAEYQSETCTNQNYLNTDNTKLFTANTSSSQDGNIYSYGNYYNFYAATAGNGPYSLTNSDAPGDICPAGWHLPSGDTNDQFANLNNAIHSVDTNTTLRDYPANFVYSGQLYGSSINYRGYGSNGQGEYLTRTSANNNLVFRMGIGSSNTNIDTYYDDRFKGRSVRCLVN